MWTSRNTSHLCFGKFSGINFKVEEKPLFAKTTKVHLALEFKDDHLRNTPIKTYR